MENSLLNEIEEEYKRIDKKWLFLHFMSSVGVAGIAFILELIIGKLLYESNLIVIPLNLFLMKYLISPTIINLLILFIGYKVLYSTKPSLDTKILTTSLLFVLICLVVFSVHRSYYNSLYVIFVAPIILTSIYGKYNTTIITSVFSLIGLITSELIASWYNGQISIFNDGYKLSKFLLSIFILLTFVFISLVVIYFERAKNTTGIKKEMERHQLRRKVQIDELTQVYNRIALRKSINEMHIDSSPNKYTFVMIDIDNFKLLNDSFGHIVGDNCLIELCVIMKKFCADVNIFRYGGDEFSILFKNYTHLQIINICESIQNKFKTVSSEYKTTLPVSLSFGIADYNAKLAPSELIKNADIALYHSKKIKDNITIFDESIMHNR